MSKNVHQTYTARPFSISEAVLDDIQQSDDSLSVIMKRHADLGDYRMIKAWERELRQKANWVGNTVPFNYVLNYFEKTQSGSPHVGQTILEKDGQAKAFVRYCHLQRDTDTRRQDCTKVEETLIDGVKSLGDMALFKAMYAHVEHDSYANDHRRVITELGVGFSPQKYRGMARTIKGLKASGEDPKRLKTLSTQFNKDWVDVTARFIDNLGYEMTDIAIPHMDQDGATAQIRISKTLGDALPMPDYKAKNRDTMPYKNPSDLDGLRDYLKKLRQKAINKYGL